MKAVEAAAKSGNVDTALIALRDKLAKAVDDAEPNMLPQVAGQYRSVLEQIAARGPKATGGAVGELAARAAKRQDRQSTAKAARTSAG